MSQAIGGDTQRLVKRGKPWSLRQLRRIGAIAVGYFGAGVLGLLLAVPPGFASPVWPASGIALAGILLWSPRVWPGIWLGSFLVNVWAAYTATNAIPGVTGFTVAASIALGSTVQALLTALLLQKWIGAGRLFTSGPSTLGFAMVVAACCVVAATWGVTTLQVTGVVELAAYLESWLTWWLGDVIGVLVLTPALLYWKHLLPVNGTPWRLVESIGSLTLLAAVTAFVFYIPAPQGEAPYALTFLPLPFLVWIACRTSPGGVATATIIVSAVAISATASGSGPFAQRVSNESLLLLQAFTGMTTLMALTLAAAVTGHKTAAATLRRLSMELEQMALTDELTGLRNRRGFLLLADQARRLARRTHVQCRLLFIDLDGLKHVNDTLGHQSGDALLMDAAQVLAAVFRESDVIGRIGGDEFAVLELLDKPGKSGNGSHRLQEAIYEFNKLGGRAYDLSMSIGIEDLPASAETSLETLLSQADIAMYGRKREQVLKQRNGRIKRSR
ncbi:MAG TPA: MASE1 domain-containing protein [Steroidobacteraceae bacterium]|nr:MASE1 domain-containing protein [Steroidobacteraceae bacterium]